MLQYTESLSPSGILRFIGPDASKFLQGQTTCHLDELDNETALFGAFCNPKGRMKTTFLLIQAAEEEYLMLLSADQCDFIKSELAPYIAFFKAEIEDTAESLKVVGVFNEDAYSTVGLEAVYQVSKDDKMVIVTLPDQRQLLIMPKDMPLDDSKYQAKHIHWDAMDIELGLVWIDECSREQFLPHDVNLPGIGGVSYDKGCYTGQEIVARMHYRGNPKYTAAVLVADEADVKFESPIKATPESGKQKTLGQIINGPVSRGEQTVVLISAAKDITDHVEIGLSNPVERAILSSIRKPHLA